MISFVRMSATFRDTPLLALLLGIASVLIAILLTACGPRDLSGTYAATGGDPPQNLIYLVLTSTSSTQLVGHFFAMTVDGTKSSGVNTQSFPVAATVNGSNLVLYVNGHQLSAQLIRDGIALQFAQSSGILNTLDYRRVSTDYVNKIISNIDRQGEAARTTYLATATATLELTNLSDGNAEFYVDGEPRCSAPSGTHCEVSVSVSDSHALSAVTSYGSQSYSTPTTQLQAEPNGVYRFEACGQTGTYGSDCGLFTISVPSN